jgi:hypothetical protein
MARSGIDTPRDRDGSFEPVLEPTHARRFTDHRRRAGGGDGGQSRPLEAVYAVVFFDALRVKIREDAVVRNKGQVGLWNSESAMTGRAFRRCITSGYSEFSGRWPAGTVEGSGIGES